MLCIRHVHGFHYKKVLSFGIISKEHVLPNLILNTKYLHQYLFIYIFTMSGKDIIS